jgi:Peptidase family M28/PDZ domain/PA domain
MRTIYALFICTFLNAGSTIGTDPDPAKYLEHVKYLASEQLRGRGDGTPELEKAAHYIAKQFHAFGLKPVNGKLYQAFQVTTSAELGYKNRLSVKNGEKTAIKFLDGFVPLNFSSSGHASGQIVFAGYGITAPEYNYDDYAGLDVKDKIVLIFRREPQEYDEKSVFAGKNYTRHSQFDSKAINARMHGAKGVILLTDLSGTTLEKFGSSAGPDNAGIPFVMMRADLAAGWMEKAGKTLRGIQEEIDKDLKPRSFALPVSIEADLTVDIARKLKTVHNVLGYLPGKTDEYLVIGAHYDHLGLGEQFSMAPAMAGTPHPGADDNASGTAGVIELARYFSRQPKMERGILFMAFAGEEHGLLGSGFYVNHPWLPMGKAVAMINMDMIGRIRDGKVYLAGSGTGSTLKKLVEDAKTHSTLEFDISEQAGYGSSDHTSFTAAQVPVLFFFSGLHGDYHKPSDTWDKINAADATKLLAFVAELGGKMLNGDRPLYVRVEPPKMGAHDAGGDSGSGGGGGYGPDFGSIPDFSEPPKGVRFADIRSGSPADKAGLKAKDIMVGFDGKEIRNLYDFTYALRGKQPGDEVEVKILRGNETLTFKVLLTKRK